MIFLESLDIWLFLVINNLPHYQILVTFFAFLSGIGTFGLVWMSWGIFLVWWEGKNRKGLYELLIATVISLVAVEFIIKPFVHRVRPEYVLTFSYLVDQTSTFSFPSTHATIAFASCWILSHRHPRWKLALYLLAFLIAFSRIYLGKHYPSDVIFGSGLGICIGIISEKVLKKISP